MSAYVPFAKFRGDWRNRGKGRVVKCRHCGYALRAFIPVTDAHCPNGHRMSVLTETPRGASAPAESLAAKKAYLGAPERIRPSGKGSGRGHSCDALETPKSGLFSPPAHTPADVPEPLP